MKAPATIDVTPERITDERLSRYPIGTAIADADGYHRAGTDPAITDAGEQLSSGRRGGEITDGSAGLSRVQRQILGTAYTMHAYGLRALAGRVRDYVTPFGIFAVYGIAPDLCARGARYTRTPKVAAAQAALSRAVTRLVERGLLVWQGSQTGLWPGGYVLTAAGLAIGGKAPIPVPHGERCVRYFRMAMECRWNRNERGEWGPSDWGNGKGGAYDWAEIIDEDLDALRGVAERGQC